MHLTPLVDATDCDATNPAKSYALSTSRLFCGARARVGRVARMHSTAFSFLLEPLAGSALLTAWV